MSTCRHRFKIDWRADGAASTLGEVISQTGSPAPDQDTSPGDGQRARLAQLHQMVVDQETASVLDARASRSPDAAQAVVLHGRAAERRRRAERIRTGLRAPVARLD